MNTFTRLAFTAFIFLFITGRSIDQIQKGTNADALLQANQQHDSAAVQKYLLQNPARVQWNSRKAPVNRPTSGKAVLSDVQPEKKSVSTSGFQILAGPTCIDTSGRLVTTQNGWTLRPGGGAITKLRDGSILVPGFHQQATTPYYIFPRLIKYDPAGNIIWAKVFDAPNVYPLNVASAYITFELNDGSILMAGEMEVPTVYNSREELILWKLDANGNVLWVQTDSSSIWAPNDGHLNVTGMAQDPAGNIYLCGNFAIQFSGSSGSFVSKMDPAGNIVWDRYFSCYATESYGILWLGNEISVYGVNPYVYAPDGSGLQTNELWNIKINPTTGDTISTKCWYPDYGANASWYSLYGFGSVVQLTNGNVGISGTAESDNYMNTAHIHGMATEFDPSFQFVRGWELASNMSGTTMITEHASGRVSYGFFPNQAGYLNDNIFGSIEQGQVIKERIIHQQNLENNWASNFLNISAGEDIEIQAATDRTTVDGEQFIRLHDSDTSSVCTGIDTLVSWIQPYHMLPLSYFKCDYISNNTFRKTNRPVPAPSDGIMQQQSPCTLKSFCDSVKLFVNHTQVCAGQPVLFTCRRNPECGARPNWIFDTTSLQSDSILNDTTLQLIYKDQYQGKLSVSMNGTCKHLSDSIQFAVVSTGTSISLGPDGWLCPDSSVVLRPAKGFAGYVWQDGSVADTMLVTAAGKYYVTVTNTCGLPLSDTIVFQQSPAANFSVGSDSSYCLKDPVTLQAPDGFNQYFWRIGNQTINNNIKSFIVYPPATTQYIAIAQTALGCVVKDSILITIKVPDPVWLGNDTSFCAGDSILLNAGSGFQNYSWTTGASSATIRVSKEGTYSVRAQSANGCYGSDTVIINKPFSLPQVNLDPDNWICEGGTRTLNAGSGYQSYLWQDGSASSTLNVDTIGKYTVRVKDYNGCVGGDTVMITKILPKPAGFLMTDTSICDGFPTKIQASTQYSDYSWSTGDQNNYITVKKGGSYSLTVTDQYGCASTASVSVTTKQCVFGIYFPNAFSPNHDGHNDLFRPNVFGELTKYQLQIFNRWGQKMFESEDYTKGWEGNLDNLVQVSGAYAWICHYQFEGEPEKMQSGTVVLIR